ncbi:hypothetical protein R3X28_08760 [Maribacter sp. TH_r10]|uniref:outer membrane protein assembly factor BamB family protein n=1 Tax=Maribacter TaxID=252356 RepID=UPI0024912422|nr:MULTISPECIES: PQQ-binding-like beta-propeller repeat protein [Maribacter]MDV7138965.1 hypothetical protein [Maribacter sp. TH_r10]
MVLNKIKKIENVYSIVKIDNSSLLVSFEKENAVIYHSNDLGVFGETTQKLDILEVFKKNDNVYFLDVWSKLFKQNKEYIIPFLEDYKCTDSSQIKNHIVLYKGKIWNRKFCVYSLSKKEILWELENISIIVISDYCFSRKKTKFKARNIETGEVLWKKTITDDFQEAKNYKFFTVYNKVLVIAVNDSILAGYNVETGELLWSVTKTNNRNLLVDIDGKLKGVTSTGYFETEIETGIHRRIEFAPYEAINEPGWFDSQRDTFVIIDNHIITTDFFSNRIGAFNLETLQYDWFYTEENAKGFPASRPIKYFAPYLCVIDNADTLHIYKMNDLIA